MCCRPILREATQRRQVSNWRGDCCTNGMSRWLKNTLLLLGLLLIVAVALGMQWWK
jgi:hypothetical protein